MTTIDDTLVEFLARLLGPEFDYGMDYLTAWRQGKTLDIAAYPGLTPDRAMVIRVRIEAVVPQDRR